MEAPETAISNSLLRPVQLEKWLLSGHLPTGMPEQLHPGFQFTTRFGLVTIHHQVDVVDSNRLRLILSQGIDGFHEWYWGEGWIQSRLEGISILPLALGQSLNLLSLRQFLAKKS